MDIKMEDIRLKVIEKHVNINNFKNENIFFSERDILTYIDEITSELKKNKSQKFKMKPIISGKMN